MKAAFRASIPEPTNLRVKHDNATCRKCGGFMSTEIAARDRIDRRRVINRCRACGHTESIKSKS